VKTQTMGKLFNHTINGKIIIKSSNYQIFKSPNHQIFKSPNLQIIKSSNHQIFKSSNLQIIKSPNHQITKLSNHQINCTGPSMFFSKLQQKRQYLLILRIRFLHPGLLHKRLHSIFHQHRSPNHLN
jgi:hypothetical protein